MVITKISRGLLERIPKLDLICMLLLLTTAIIIRLFLILNAPFFYAQDAYGYLSKARGFISTGTIQFGTGTTFVLSLAGFLEIFGPVLGEISASRLFMLIISSLLVISLYFLGLRMSGRLLGLLAALAATFEPIFLEYSIVPYTESFAISMGLIALCFAASDKRLPTILAPIFFYLAILTRLELFFPLLIPILVFCFYKKMKIRAKQGVTRARLIISFALTTVVYLIPFIGLYRYGLSWGSFGIVERFALFLKPDLLKITVESSFRFYDQQFLNQTIYVFVGLGIVVAFLNIVADVKFEKTGKTIPISIRYKRSKCIKDALFSENAVTAFTLFLVFAIYVVFLTVLGFSYEWAFYVAPSDMTNLDILSKALIIRPTLHERYLILPRLLISYPIAYTLSVVLQKVYAEIGRQK